jgi:antitoxin ParD1/3/4
MQNCRTLPRGTAGSPQLPPVIDNALVRANSLTLTVSLTDALRNVVDERLRSGLYGNASEYVRELIRRDEEAARELRALYQDGIDSGESLPISGEDWDALRAIAEAALTLR